MPADCYIYKHSTACPVSAAAQVVERTEFDRPVYWVNVIEQRRLSRNALVNAAGAIFLGPSPTCAHFGVASKFQG